MQRSEAALSCLFMPALVSGYPFACSFDTLSGRLPRPGDHCAKIRITTRMTAISQIADNRIIGDSPHPRYKLYLFSQKRLSDYSMATYGEPVRASHKAMPFTRRNLMGIKQLLERCRNGRRYPTIHEMALAQSWRRKFV